MIYIKEEPIRTCVFENNACRQRYIVKYSRIPGLPLEIEHAKSENRYAKFMTELQKVKPLILDYVGLKSYSLNENRDILEIAEIRYSQCPTILAGQIPHTKWYNLFSDPTIADAIMDRFVHNSYILALYSKQSMRVVTVEKIIQDIKKGN